MRQSNRHRLPPTPGPSPSVCLHAALQQFAWTEAEVPAKLTARSASVQGGVSESEPLFCVETALKLTYVSLHMYRHFRVCTALPVWLAALCLCSYVVRLASTLLLRNSTVLGCELAVPPTCRPSLRVGMGVGQPEGATDAKPPAPPCLPATAALQPESTISSMDTLLGLYGLRHYEWYIEPLTDTHCELRGGVLSRSCLRCLWVPLQHVCWAGRGTWYAVEC